MGIDILQVQLGSLRHTRCTSLRGALHWGVNVCLILGQVVCTGQGPRVAPGAGGRAKDIISEKRSQGVLMPPVTSTMFPGSW